MKPIDFLKHHCQNHHSFIHLRYIWRSLSRDSFQVLVWKISRKLLSIVLGILLLPLSFILHLIGFRRVTVFTDRIGHLAVEPDCLLKEQALGLITKQRWFILAPPGRVANYHLLKYWEPHFRIYRGRMTCYVLASMSRWKWMKHDISHYLNTANKTQEAYRVYAQWSSRTPLLTLTQDDIEWGDRALQEMGIPKDAWFVCVHAREGGFSPIDEELLSHRNTDIKNTIPAIKEIRRKGGWVIRIGDPTMKQFEVMPQFIDYAHHSMKCPRLDVILCARARFILGNTSGIALVGTAFGVPCAQANMTPMSALGLLPTDISIPMLHWSLSKSCYLDFSEIMDSPISNYRYASLFVGAGIRLDENTKDDINNLTIEMLDRLEGRYSENEEDRTLQQRYLSLFHQGHYAYGAASRVSFVFLRKYRNLLGS